MAQINENTTGLFYDQWKFVNLWNVATGATAICDKVLFLYLWSRTNGIKEEKQWRASSVFNSLVLIHLPKPETYFKTNKCLIVDNNCIVRFCPSGIASGSMMNNNSGPPSYSMSLNRSSGGFNEFSSNTSDNSLESLNAMEKSLSEQVCKS